MKAFLDEPGPLPARRDGDPLLGRWTFTSAVSSRWLRGECDGLSVFKISLSISPLWSVSQLSRNCHDCHSVPHKSSRQNEMVSELLSQEPVQDILRETTRTPGVHGGFCTASLRLAHKYLASDVGTIRSSPFSSTRLIAPRNVN